MAEKYSFFNSVNSDRLYTAEDFAEYFASFIGTGVYPSPATNLQVTAGSGMNVVVSAGKAWLNGYFYQNTAALTLSLTNASGTLKRIDSIVIQCDFTNRLMKAAVKVGTPSSSPVAPALVRTADLYEIQLATVYIAAGAASITQSNITDTRQNNSVCGLVAGIVEQIDTTNLFAQYDNAFTTWFNSVKGQLSGDVAANLQDQITAQSNSISSLQSKDVEQDTAISKKASTMTYTVNIGTTWTGTAAPYTQTVTVAGITANDNPIVDIYSSSTSAKFKLEMKAYSLVGKITTAANSITLICYDKKPTTAFGLQLKVVK